MDWIKLKDKQPTIAEQGVKVLLHRIMNDDQKLLSTTIHETSMVKHCNPDETWWMPLPEPPSEGKTADASTEPSINYDGVLADGAQRSEPLICPDCGSKNCRFIVGEVTSHCRDCGLPWAINGS